MRVLVTLTHVQALEQTYPGEMQPHAECTPAQGWDTAQGRHCGSNLQTWLTTTISLALIKKGGPSSTHHNSCLLIKC